MIKPRPAPFTEPVRSGAPISLPALLGRARVSRAFVDPNAGYEISGHKIAESPTAQMLKTGHAPKTCIALRPAMASGGGPAQRETEPFGPIRNLPTAKATWASSGPPCVSRNRIDPTAAAVSETLLATAE